MWFDELEDYRGRWVAIDREHESVVASAIEDHELRRQLKDREVANVLIQRVPAGDDPIFIGLA